MKPERRKTTIILPKKLIAQLDVVGGQIGATRSSMIAMGAAFLLAQLSPLHGTPKKRRMALGDIQQEFQKLVDEALDRL